MIKLPIDQVLNAERPTFFQVGRTLLVTILLAALFWAQFEALMLVVSEQQKVIAAFAARLDEHGRNLSRHALELDRYDDRLTAVGAIFSNHVLAEERRAEEQAERARRAAARRRAQQAERLEVAE